jgi:hypothetical protein
MTCCSNITPPSFEAQKGGTCYAHASASAYINTCARIFSLKPRIPSYDECVTVADYNHGNGGSPQKSICLLEEKYQCGVRCKTLQGPPKIRDILSVSVIIFFTTSEAGWKAISSGSLMEPAPGDPEGWHATLAEGYDFSEDCVWAKNSWGHAGTVKERFKFRFSAFPHCWHVLVFSTTVSIIGKTLHPYKANMRRFDWVLDGKPIQCAYMDEQTARYETGFLCECIPSWPPPLNWVGYDLDQYIAIKSKKP